MYYNNVRMKNKEVLLDTKEYLKQAYLLDKQICVEIQELENLKEMRSTIQGCSYGEKSGSSVC